MDIQLSDFRYSEPIHMRWSDIDELHHVNNAVYLTYFEQGRSNFMRTVHDFDWREDGFILARAEIDYLMPLFYTDEPKMYVRCSRVGSKSFNLEYIIVNEKDGKQDLIAKCRSVQVMYNFTRNESIPVSDEIRAKLEA